MASASAQSSALYIERLHNCYLVPGDHQAPEEVRSLCESAIGARLSDSLATVLTRCLPATDPSLWFIRRLNIDFAINPEIHLSSLADVWAKEIASGLIAALRAGQGETLHFPDRASYLASFLLDLAEGSAWSRWYYGPFEGLRMLSSSAAIRTAICDSAETGLQALCLLSETKRGALVKAVTTTDAAVILKTIVPHAVECDEANCFQAISDLWSTILNLPNSEEERRALLLFLNISRDHPALATQTLGGAVAAICRLARRLHDDHWSKNRQLLTALRQGDILALHANAGLEDAAVLAPLLRCPPECLAMLLQQITGGPVVDPETSQETRFTPFGGAFLLFPLLDQLPLQAATQGWPDLGNTSATSVARSLILAICFGRERAPGCFRDPLLRDLMGINPQISADMVSAWLSEISADNLQTFVREVAGWHLESGAAEAENFQFVSVAGSGAQTVVVVDSACGLWLYARNASSETCDLFAPLNQLCCPRTFQCDESLLESVRKSFPETQPESSSELPLPDVTADLDYLALPEEFGGGRQVDLTLAMAAQNVLRLFARRLTGFTRSSLTYLHSNFLDCSAAVEETAEQRVVCLGRPPLHLVLAMAGLNRCSYQLSWLQGRACAIFPEG